MPKTTSLFFWFIAIPFFIVACSSIEPTGIPISPTSISTPTPTSQESSPVETVTHTVTAVPDNTSGLIVFFSDRDGNQEIYIMQTDGTDQRNLTNNSASDTDPAWSPDGSQIAFSSDRDGNLEIYVMDSDGANTHRLTHNPGIDVDPTWSPDGKQIAFVSLRDGNAEVYLINIDSTGLRRLTNNSYSDWEIDWSPDGTQIAVASQVGEFANIYLLNVEETIRGSPLREQLTDTDAHDGFPRWSPDGSQLAFISNRVGKDNWEVFVMRTDGSDQRRLTNSDGLDGIPSWSPNGTQITFESGRDGDNEIYMLNVDEALTDPEGAVIIQLTDNNASDMHPSWRPAQGMFEPDTRIEVPNVSAPIIDGSFSEGEWEGAMLIDMTNDGEMMVMHDGGYLYLGIRSREMGFGSICTLDGDRVSILHSSAGLGTAIFEKDGEDWARVQQFSYCCWEATSSRLDEFLQEEGWVASLGTMGLPNEMEYQIAIPDGTLTLAVVYLDDFTFETALYWPLDLQDDCLGLALIPEDPPERLIFSPEKWASVVALME